MADTKLSALAELTAPDDADEIYTRDASEPAASQSKRALLSTIKNWLQTAFDALFLRRVSNVADGATAIAHELDTAVSYATNGSKLLSIKNNGAEKAAIDKNGYVISPLFRSDSGLLEFSVGHPTFGGVELLEGSFTGYTNGLGNVTGTTVRTRNANRSIRIKPANSGQQDIVVISGSDSAGGNTAGGNVYLTGGVPTGTGEHGHVIVQNLPTSDPAILGALWNDSGALKISAG